MTQVVLVSEFPADLIGLPGRAPLLSWSVTGAPVGSSQVAAQIQSSGDADFASVQGSKQIDGDASQFVEAPGGVMVSREVRYYRVRIQTNAAEGDAGWSAWSNVIRHEVGLLGGMEFFAAQAIGDVSKPTDAPALLRTEFSLEKPVASARLYATAHGTFDLMINGQRVGDEVLAPGWTPYHERLLVVTHDVTALLQQGANAWGVLLADGWFRGKFGFTAQTGNYGQQTAFIGQIEVTFTDGSKQRIATGPEWMTGQGGVRFASIYDGTDFDYNFVQPAWCKPGFDTAANASGNWKPVTVHALNKSSLEPRYAAPVRAIAEWPAALNNHAGNTRVSLEQNIAGWLKIKVKATAGSKLTAKHAEILEPSGDIHTKALRFARATDSWVFAKDGEYELEPKQTFHGFQYADLIAEGSVEILEVTGIAISSDISARGSIETNLPILNKLVSNTYWSLRDNFVSIPTDCPQRDERLGWTGDAQAFIYAAHTLVNGDEFFRTWLRDLAIEQKKLGGKVPMVIPDLLSPGMNEGHPFFALNGEAGWSDAATVIPWSMYQRFGDEQILRDQLDSMRAWVAHNTADHEGILIGPRMQLGDWLDPDAPEGQPWAAKVSGQFMSNAYHYQSLKIMSQVEALVGSPDESVRLNAYANELRNLIWSELGEAAAATPTGAATLLEFDLAPASERQRIADNLAAGVRATDGRIATGFLGTPIILDAMSRNGHLEEAFLMLLRQEMPSWLYPITKGATTIWERWNGILPDGNINQGGLEGGAEGSGEGMISFNHYAYGAVVDWIYRNIGGIVPTTPGYRRVSIAPRPQVALTSCRSAIETGYGRIALEWEIRDGNLVGELTVPFGVEATFDLLGSANSSLVVDSASVERGHVLGAGTHTFLFNNPLISR
jgi:alpha-L-rhamnosidase